MTKNLAASVRVRLRKLAKEQDADFNQVLVRFALERILYRLSQSKHTDRFVLKGALLFNLWYNLPHRPTRDADLLGFGPSDLESIRATFEDVAGVPVEDGMTFDLTTVRVEEIRKDAGYAGARVKIDGELNGARCTTQIDIGFGDAVTPDPTASTYPVLLEDLPAPRMRTYPVYTVISEKLHAIVVFGMTNSRLKDYFDLSVLLERETLDAKTLAVAVAATFARRETDIPDAVPLGLTDEFATDGSRQELWQAFLKKNGLPEEPLKIVVRRLRDGLVPALREASSAFASGGDQP